jgi:hypothetical protein
MMELQMTLDFSCCICSEPVSVTVKCAGKGLWKKGQDVASVSVPCPGCGHVNQLSLEPGGMIRDVAPYAGLRRLPEPSNN